MLWSQKTVGLADSTEKPDTFALRELADEELAKAFQSGNHLAFQELLSRHQKSLFNFLHRLTRNLQTAEDAFQEVFLRVVRSIDEYRPSAKFTTWLYTIARNYCIDLNRRGVFRNHVSMEGQEEAGRLRLQFAVQEASVDQKVGDRDVQTRLMAILEELNLEQKEVFVMREFQGLAFEEIAKIVGASTNTIKSRMRYALQFIKKKFIEVGYTPESWR